MIKGILTFLAIIVILGGFGWGGWLLVQTTDELNQAKSTINSINANLSTAQTQLNEEKTRSANLQIKIQALESELESIKQLVGEPQSDIAAEISRLNAELAKAKADANATLVELTKIKNPRHFYTIEELRAWLEQDDTNTNPNYETLGLADKAFILQVKALRDGYLLPAAIDADSDHIYSWNIAVVGAGIYVVTADTDEVLFLANFGAPPAQPIP